MLEAPLTEQWQVRPPWSDEAPRVGQHFRLLGLRVETRRAWYWVLVAGELERIVGVMELAEDVLPNADSQQAPLARLEYSLREGWADGEGAKELLQTALRKAKELGLVYHSCQADPEGVFATLLREAGFVMRQPQEVWVCPLASSVAEYVPRWAHMLQRFPITVTPLDESHLEKVRDMCTRYKLLTPDSVVLQKTGDQSQQGFDPRFSFLAGDPADPAAILLARIMGEDLYIEVIARNPDAPQKGVSAIAALLNAAMPAAHKLGLEQLSCVFRPDESEEVQFLLERGGGKRVRRFALFVWAPELAGF